MRFALLITGLTLALIGMAALIVRQAVHLHQGVGLVALAVAVVLLVASDVLGYHHRRAWKRD
jgi:uncharacterized membrane protein